MTTVLELVQQADNFNSIEVARDLVIEGSWQELKFFRKAVQLSDYEKDYIDGQLSEQEQSTTPENLVYFHLYDPSDKVLAKIVEKVNKANAKLKVSDIGYYQLRGYYSYYEKVRVPGTDNEVEIKNYVIYLVLPYKFGEWELFGELEAISHNTENAGSVIRCYGRHKVSELPQEFFQYITSPRTSNLCVACSENRYRTSRLVLCRGNGTLEEKDEFSSWKEWSATNFPVVGSSCLNNYIPEVHLSLLKLNESLKTNRDKLTRFSYKHFKEGSFLLPVYELVSQICAIFRVDGRWIGYDNGYDATTRKAYSNLVAMSEIKNPVFAVTDEDRDTADAVISYWKERVLTTKASSEKELNTRRVMESPRVRYNMYQFVGHACAVFFATSGGLDRRTRVQEPPKEITTSNATQVSPGKLCQDGEVFNNVEFKVATVGRVYRNTFGVRSAAITLTTKRHKDMTFTVFLDLDIYELPNVDDEVQVSGKNSNTWSSFNKAYINVVKIKKGGFAIW